MGLRWAKFPQCAHIGIEQAWQSEPGRARLSMTRLGPSHTELRFPSSDPSQAGLLLGSVLTKPNELRNELSSFSSFSSGKYIYRTRVDTSPEPSRVVMCRVYCTVPRKRGHKPCRVEITLNTRHGCSCLMFVSCCVEMWLNTTRAVSCLGLGISTPCRGKLGPTQNILKTIYMNLDLRRESTRLQP